MLFDFVAGNNLSCSIAQQTDICQQPEIPYDLGRTNSSAVIFEKSDQTKCLNRNFYANGIFCIYALGILCLDLAEFDSAVNSLSYVWLGGLNLASAWLYRSAWVGRAWSDPFVYPEVTNILAAALYLGAAALYGKVDGRAQAATTLVNTIEAAAAVMDFAACLGWGVVWHLTYPRLLGRGYTPRDLDIWALLISVLGAAIYIFYNFQKLHHPDTYSVSRLYFFADIFYFCAGFLFLLASRRDQQGLDLEPNRNPVFTQSKASRLSSPKYVG